MDIPDVGSGAISSGPGSSFLQDEINSATTEIQSSVWEIFMFLQLFPEINNTNGVSVLYRDGYAHVNDRPVRVSAMSA